MKDLEITLNLSGETPIYQQIESQIRTQILNGELEAGQAVPSMRTLARMLHVSVITVQKAYELLRQEGLIESAVGRGSVVASISREQQLEEKRRELSFHLDEALALARVCGLSLQDLKDMIDALDQEDPL